MKAIGLIQGACGSSTASFLGVLFIQCRIAFFISEFSKGVYISTGWIPDGPVMYSVRFISDADGTISTVSEFQEYETLQQARDAARAFQKA